MFLQDFMFEGQNKMRIGLTKLGPRVLDLLSKKGNNTSKQQIIPILHNLTPRIAKCLKYCYGSYKYTLNFNWSNSTSTTCFIYHPYVLESLRNDFQYRKNSLFITVLKALFVSIKRWRINIKKCIIFFVFCKICFCEI